MSNKLLYDDLIRRITAWEKRVELNEKSTTENLLSLFNVTNRKDEDLRSIVGQFQELMKMQPEMQREQFKSTMEMVKQCNDNGELLVKRIETMMEKMEQQKQDLEHKLKHERFRYNRVIDALIERNRRFQGRDELGSRLMRMVSEREDEIRQKYQGTVIDFGSKITSGNQSSVIKHLIPRIN